MTPQATQPIISQLCNEMRINVAQLLKEPVGSTRSYQINESVGKEGTNSIKGEVTLTHTNRGILVKGTMTANVTGVCSRCLNSADCSVNFDLEDEFLPSMDTPKGLSLPKEPDSFAIDSNHVLDLSEVIRQYTLLAMPTKLLCRPDCAGICPSCGHNLNQGPCQCPPQVHDQRWSKLVLLKKGERSLNGITKEKVC